jgi:beta-glucuronidase
MTEYGTDTVVGLHAVCDVLWSEEYQIRFLEMFHRVFDRIDNVVGEDREILYYYFINVYEI